MKTHASSLVPCAAAVIAVVGAQAEEKLLAAAPPAASVGLLNDWLRSQSDAFNPWDIGGQFRVRLEHKGNFAIPGQPGAVDFSRNSEDNTYWLLREKVHLGYAPSPWVGAFVEARDSSSHGDKRNPNPESDTFDLHQAHVMLGNAKEFPLTAKVGRQELSYGDERLVGAFDWNNLGRVFDAARLRFENEQLWLDSFVSRVVLVDDNNFNEANDYDVFSGVYASTRTLIPKQETQLYFLARNTSAQSPSAIGAGLPPLLTGASPRDIYTLGLRVKSLPGQFGGWDYEAECAGQFGRFKSGATSASLDHEAFAAHVAGGYTWSRAYGTPHVGLEYNYASGDTDSTDGRHETFENLFPTNHKFYGYMDFVSWQNIHNVRASASLNPHKKLSLTLDGHAFWLADTRDAFYQVNGAPRTAGGYGINRGAGSYVGSEIDLIATFAIRPYAVLQAGYGHFFVGDYVKNSLRVTGGSSDADYVYLQMVFNF